MFHPEASGFYRAIVYKVEYRSWIFLLKPVFQPFFTPFLLLPAGKYKQVQEKQVVCILILRRLGDGQECASMHLNVVFMKNGMTDLIVSYRIWIWMGKGGSHDSV